MYKKKKNIGTEQGNHLLNRIRTAANYMTLPTFMKRVKLMLSMDNRQVIRKYLKLQRL